MSGRSTRWLAALALLLAAALPVAAEAGRRRPPVQVIAAYSGDSLTTGQSWVDMLPASWVRWLPAPGPHTLAEGGLACGSPTGVDVAGHLAMFLGQIPPGAVVAILCGTNDLADFLVNDATQVQATFAAVDQMLVTARAAGHPVVLVMGPGVWSNPALYLPRARYLRAGFTELAARRGAHLVDVLWAFETNPRACCQETWVLPCEGVPWLQNDAVHLNYCGRRLVASLVRPQIEAAARGPQPVPVPAGPPLSVAPHVLSPNPARMGESVRVLADPAAGVGPMRWMVKCMGPWHEVHADALDEPCPVPQAPGPFWARVQVVDAVGDFADLGSVRLDVMP